MLVPQIGDPLLSQSHVEILGIVVLPLLGFWLDWRRQHREDSKVRLEQHIEGQIRLAAIETQLKPIAEWWNRLKRQNGGD
jgi:hypothetical protein